VMILRVVLLSRLDPLLQVRQFHCLLVPQVVESLRDFLGSFLEPDLFFVRKHFFNFLLHSVGLDVIFLFGHLFFHFPQVEQFRRLLDFGAQLDVEFVFKLEAFVSVFGEKNHDVFFTLSEELVHVGGPKLIDLIDFVVELVVEVVALSFVGVFHFMELFVFELLFTMLPFGTTPFGIDVLSFLFVLDHFLVQDSEVCVKTEHPAGSHELTHLDEDIFVIW
jgi:hypothetical protein